MKKSVHFTTVHPLKDVRIYYKQCVSLAAKGWEVTLLAPGTESGMESGVQLVPLNRPRNRIARMTVTSASVLRKLLAIRADVYHFHDPELIPVGLVLRLLGRTVVYDVHEDVPAAILNRHWIPGPLRRAVSWAADCAEKAGGMLFNGIIGATPHIASRFPRAKTALVQNYPILSPPQDSQAPREVDEQPDRVAFVGWISLERGIAQVLDALVIANRKRPVRLTLAGNYHGNIAAQLESSAGWQYVDFLGWRSRDEVAELLAAAKAGIVTFLPIPNHVESQPNKLFEYMSAGLPVIASDFPRWREFVGDRGRLVDPEDPESIAEAILYFIENAHEAKLAGERGRHAVGERYNWASESEQLIEFYDRLLAA